MKPGYKTTEFWLSAAAALVGLLIASGAFEETSTVGKVIALAASSLAALGYSVSRGIAKKQTPAS